MSSAATLSCRWQPTFGVIWDVARPLPGKPLFSPPFRINSKMIRLMFHYNEDHDYSLETVGELPDGIQVTARAEDKHEREIAGYYSTSKPFRIYYMNTNKIIADLSSGDLITFNITFRKQDTYGHFLFQFKPFDIENKGIQISACVNNLPCLENLSEDFSKLLEGGEGATQPDVMMVCGDQTAHAHSLVLRSRSDVLAAMLGNDMEEKRTGRIELRDMDTGIFQIFVRYLYTGVLPELTVEVAKCLYEVGDRHAVKGLIKRCALYLEENLTEENACELLVLADAHNDREFKENVINYIVDNKIHLRNKDWDDFYKSHESLANEVHFRYCKKMRKYFLA